MRVQDQDSILFINTTRIRLKNFVLSFLYCAISHTWEIFHPPLQHLPRKECREHWYSIGDLQTTDQAKGHVNPIIQHKLGKDLNAIQQLLMDSHYAYVSLFVLLRLNKEGDSREDSR